ncbi:MAG: GDYXXLXY domain-containing protein [Granulosicoccus sp.]|nr:GDYXXLXY domain-containing protein [Granulosicoccus sp.]
MRKWAIILCVAGQLAVLAFMVFGREWIIHTGTQVQIATAPIDPRDPFRGDFVRLRYGLNSLGYAPARWQPATYEPKKGDKVFAVLEPRPGGLHDVSYFTNVAPAADTGALYIRGRMKPSARWSRSTAVDAAFGIEQLFVEQGSGLDIEKRRGIRGGLQNAMHARVSIGDTGTAVLTGFDWSALAIGLDISPTFALVQAINESRANVANDGTTAAPTDDPDPPSPPLRLTVSNVSDDILMLNNPAGNCGFRLEPAARMDSAYFEPENVCADALPRLLTLAVGDSLVIDIDLADPRWHMSRSIDGVVKSGDVRTFDDFTEWFRLAYRSDRQGTEIEGNALWQGDLLSQAFNARGQRD